MKKWNKMLLAGALSLSMLVGGSLMLTGCTTSAPEIDLRINGDYIQWTQDGESWSNLILLEDLKGKDGVGVNGREVEFQTTSTYIQWRYKTEDDSDTWKNLLALEDIKGKDLTAEECTITYNFNLGKAIGAPYNYQLLNDIFARDGFNQSQAEIVNGELLLSYTQIAEKGNYFDLYEMDSLGLGDYFQGWYVDDIKVNKLNIVGGDIELTAQWKDGSLTSKICTDPAEYKYYQENDGVYTVSAYPIAGGNYLNLNGVYVFRLNELHFYENKFYKITGYSLYDGGNKSEGEQPVVGCIEIPETAYGQFKFDIDVSSYMALEGYYVSKAGINPVDGTKHYIGNYVIIEQGNYGNQNVQIEYVYEVDYSKCEATLVRSFTYGNIGDYGLKNDTKITIINDFEAERDGKTYNIKVTKVADGWFKPWYELQRDDYGFQSRDYYGMLTSVINIGFIVGDGVDSIGGFNNIGEPNNSDEIYVDQETGEPKFTLNVNYYSLKNKPTLIVEERGTSVLNVSCSVYYYSETQPTNSEHNYWHYDEDGKTPIIWEIGE